MPVVFPPVIRNEWSGSMKIEMLNDGRIRVWERREFAITDVSFSNERFGFFDVSLKGWRFQVSRADSGFIEFIPVGGPSRECEIILREKHPALETDSEGFQRIPMVNGRALSILPDSWIGVPLLQVIDDGRIQITSTSADVEYAIHSGSQGITFGPSFARIWLAVERGKLTMYRHHQPDLPMVGLGPLRGLDGSAPRGWIDFVLLGSDEVNLSDFGEVVGTPIMVADSGFDVISTSADPLSQFAVIVQRRSRNLVRLHFIDTRLTRWRVEKGNSLKLISGLDFLPVTGDPVTGEILLPSTPALETKADGSLTLVLEGVIPHSIDPQKCLFEGSGGRWNGVPHLAIDTQGVLRIAAGTTDTPYLLIQDCSQGAGKVVLEWKPVPELFRQVEAEPSLAGPDSGCPICLEDFETNEMVARTKCRHDYHLSCLSNLRESGMAKCALCRANLRGL